MLLLIVTRFGWVANVHLLFTLMCHPQTQAALLTASTVPNAGALSPVCTPVKVAMQDADAPVPAQGSSGSNIPDHFSDRNGHAAETAAEAVRVCTHRDGHSETNAPTTPHHADAAARVAKTPATPASSPSLPSASSPCLSPASYTEEGAPNLDNSTDSIDSIDAFMMCNLPSKSSDQVGDESVWDCASLLCATGGSIHHHPPATPNRPMGAVSAVGASTVLVFLQLKLCSWRAFSYYMGFTHAVGVKSTGRCGSLAHRSGVPSLTADMHTSCCNAVGTPTSSSAGALSRSNSSSFHRTPASRRHSFNNSLCTSFGSTSDGDCMGRSAVRGGLIAPYTPNSANGRLSLSRVNTSCSSGNVLHPFQRSFTTFDQEGTVLGFWTEL
jgi:hypothetical protein